MDSTDHLRHLLCHKSLKIGDFTLASGRKSKYYVDARLTTMSGQGQNLVGEVCFGMLRTAGWAPSFVGGLTLGADPVAYAIAAYATRQDKTLDGFTVRKEAKGHGTQRQIEGGLPRDAQVVVVDDTVTSGGSTLRAVQAVEAHGCRVLGALALIDREEGAKELLAEAGHQLLATFTLRELLITKEVLGK